MCISHCCSETDRSLQIPKAEMTVCILTTPPRSLPTSTGASPGPLLGAGCTTV